MVLSYIAIEILAFEGALLRILENLTGKEETQ